MRIFNHFQCVQGICVLCHHLKSAFRHRNFRFCCQDSPGSSVLDSPQTAVRMTLAYLTWIPHRLQSGWFWLIWLQLRQPWLTCFGFPTDCSQHDSGLSDLDSLQTAVWMILAYLTWIPHWLQSGSLRLIWLGFSTDCSLDDPTSSDLDSSLVAVRMTLAHLTCLQ